MRIHRAALAAVAALAGVAGADSGKAQVGKEVPDLTLRTLDGKEIRLSDLRAKEGKEGKVVILASWSSDCPSGKPNLGWHEEMAKWAKEKGVVYVGIAMYGEPAEKIKKHCEESQSGVSVAKDDEETTIASTLDAKTVNTAWVIDAKGALQYAGGFEGRKDGEKVNLVKQAAEELLAGKEVSVKASKPAG